jgi:hypothetical protein
MTDWTGKVFSRIANLRHDAHPHALDINDRPLRLRKRPLNLLSTLSTSRQVYQGDCGQGADGEEFM